MSHLESGLPSGRAHVSHPERALGSEELAEGRKALQSEGWLALLCESR